MKISNWSDAIIKYLNISMKVTGYLILFTGVFVLSFNVSSHNCRESSTDKKSLVWKLDCLDEIGGYQPLIIGNPEIIPGPYGNAVYFNGLGDGLIIPVNPVENWRQFTVEVLFKPDSDGPAEQRFIHFQDIYDNRGLIETRVTHEGKWILDTFLYNAENKTGLTLIDRKKLHPGNKWYWAALVYDGGKMSHYVNGKKELEGEIEFGPMTSGKISLGVRLNKVFWFTGMIREIRFHPVVLNESELQIP